MKVLIAGGSGLVGTYLANKLNTEGIEFSILSRNKKNSNIYKSYIWDIEKNYIEDEAFNNVDFIINLAGENIADSRWTEERKNEIIKSRIASTNLIFNKLVETKTEIKAYISASGTGFYGSDISQNIYKENDDVGNDFLANVCNLWENAANQFNTIGVRTVILRTGIVLAKNGGIIDKLKKSEKLGILANFGTGKGYMPWIHIEDLCMIYIKSVIDKNMNGIYNIVAPEHITNNDFVETMSKVLNRKHFKPNIPSFLLKAAFGELYKVLIGGSRISSEKIINTNYTFEFETLEKALSNILNTNN